MRIRELSQTKMALGADITLAIATGMPSSQSDGLFDRLWQQIFDFERRFSRFLPMSELSIFNRTTGLNVSISTDFRQLLISAKSIGIDTNGLFNPFILPALQRAGYKQSAAPGYETDVQIDYTGRRVVAVDELTIGDTWASIPFGTALDMGGCGKGYLADQLSQSLSGKSIEGYWLSLGGDVVTAGRDENGDRINLNIQSANQLDGVADWTVSCPSEHFGVATSGTFRRQGQSAKTAWHHIIDPHTLKPAVTDIKLATICAATALRADVLASCAVMLGSKKAPAFLKKHGATSALLQGETEAGMVFETAFGPDIKLRHLSQIKGVSAHE